LFYNLADIFRLLFEIAEKFEALIKPSLLNSRIKAIASCKRFRAPC
jgi:hypothetical protein